MTLVAIAVGTAQFLFYVALSTLLQRVFYRNRFDQRAAWKLQPTKNSVEHEAEAWWFPFISVFTGFRKADRHRRHVLFATINLTVSCVFAAFVAHCFWIGKSHIFTSVAGVSSSVPHAWWRVADLLGGFDSVTYGLAATFLAVVYENVAEYYWHRMQHLPWFYKHLHKYHHYYKAPGPFDDMMIHPLEGAGYYCILYGPAFFIPMPLWGFMIYMSIMGLCGVLDHCGISFEVPGYHTRFHDMHHQFFNCNYSFPFTFMDHVHGTYKHDSDMLAAKHAQLSSPAVNRDGRVAEVAPSPAAPASEQQSKKGA